LRAQGRNMIWHHIGSAAALDKIGGKMGSRSGTSKRGRMAGRKAAGKGVGKPGAGKGAGHSGSCT
jgi:hypothetical protein